MKDNLTLMCFYWLSCTLEHMVAGLPSGEFKDKATVYMKEFEKSFAELRSDVQPNSEPQPQLPQANVMWAQSAEPLPCCSKCGMTGQPLGTRCLAEDCLGAQQGNGT